jgi:glycosyltransferase involved in cell wall biosynthesis
VSETTRRDVVTRYGIPPERVRVVYHGVNPRFKPVRLAASQQIKDKYQLPDQYILAVGTIEPRKNLVVLLEAYHVLRQHNPDLQLVIAGKRGWHSEPFFERLQTLGLTDQVKLLGFVPDEDLPALYNFAEAFAFPSIYEGFGLPVLEAMACGTPVVCSNTSSLPEVAGEAALLLAPTDTRGWSTALQQVLDNPALRADLRQRGLRQAAQFTWAETAQQTLALYRTVGTH